MSRRTVLFVLLVVGLVLAAGPSRAECIRSCTASLFVQLTYQPEGQASVQKKTGWVKTAPTAQRDGRYGGGCGPVGLIKAKEASLHRSRPVAG